MMANISPTLDQDLKDLNMSYQLFDRNGQTPDERNYNGTPLEITIYDYNKGITFKSYKLPKNKLVDLEWVMNKWNAEKTFQNFTENFKELLKKEGILNTLSCYPTTYGIGISILFSYRRSAVQLRDQISALLDKKGIEYRTELSDAAWVFRFVISKKKENIEKLK